MGIPDICFLCDRSGKTDEKKSEKKENEIEGL
jgi:hypothetical protein